MHARGPYAMPRTRSLAWAELKIGLVTLFAIAMAAILIFMLTGSSGFFWQSYSIKTVFSNIAGLKTGAPVRLAGVEIGSVKEMRLFWRTMASRFDRVLTT